LRGFDAHGFGSSLANKAVGFHIMITSTSNTTSTNAAADFNLTQPATNLSSAGSTDPFGQQLATAIEQHRDTTGNTQIAQSQVSDGRQVTAAVSQPSAVPVIGTSLMDFHGFGTGTVATSKATAAAASGDNAAAIATAATTTPATGPTIATVPADVVDKSKMTPDDAYWAEQPPAVQALRGMAPEDVGQAAMALAKQGYTIDVPIMVWQWDPLTTMVERQNYGYTWVPSGLGTPVTLPPGLSFPGLASYDPNSPPPGSIKVTTDFARGTNMQDMYIDAATIQASFAD
jgi:hypothetical protein